MSSTAFGNLGPSGVNAAFPRAPQYVNTLTSTAASAPYSLVIPAGAKYVRLSPNVDGYVKWGTTGVTTVASSDGTGSEFVPYQAGGVCRDIGSTLSTTAISFVSTGAACTVTQSWWTA